MERRNKYCFPIYFGIWENISEAILSCQVVINIFYTFIHCSLLILIKRWLYGHTGCQLYAAAGFFFGIGVIISLGLIILEGFLIIYGPYITVGKIGAVCNLPNVTFSGIAPFPRSKLHSLMMIGISWLFTLLFVIPPYMDLFGM